MKDFKVQIVYMNHGPLHGREPIIRVETPLSIIYLRANNKSIKQARKIVADHIKIQDNIYNLGTQNLEETSRNISDYISVLADRLDVLIKSAVFKK